MTTLLKFDQKFYKDGYRYLIGIDEAGRGPLAGPVVAAAVLLFKTDFSASIQDSKKMTPRQRDKAFIEIFEKAHIGVGMMSETVIDEVNILQATFMAMNAAIRELMGRLRQADYDLLNVKGICLLVDGNHFSSDFDCDVKTITGGDNRSLSIACASIIAKVTRDRILDQYHKIFPEYGFDRHKGYPTVAHRRALEEHGATPIHRKTFRTVRNVIGP